MPTAPAQPPPLPRDRAPLFAGAGVGFAVFAATRMSGGALPAFTCALMRWTGIPCPACGGTRCLAACGRLDLGAAFAWNPLAAIAAVALLGWSALALADARLANQATMRLGSLLTGRRIAAVVALNWLYLCFTLPR